MGIDKCFLNTWQDLKQVPWNLISLPTFAGPFLNCWFRCDVCRWQRHWHSTTFMLHWRTGSTCTLVLQESPKKRVQTGKTQFFFCVTPEVIESMTERQSHIVNQEQVKIGVTSSTRVEHRAQRVSHTFWPVIRHNNTALKNMMNRARSNRLWSAIC